MDERRQLFVTRPTLPPLDQVLPMLQHIWDARVLTNGGPYHQQLERALGQYLGLPHISVVNNATTGLLLALKDLSLEGEVITSPFSFVATTHALRWCGLTPVFADIDPVTFNLDPARVEAAITERTCAILPVHCYGQPCDVEAFDRLGKQYGLKVIYDAAHAFGVTHAGRSLSGYGDHAVLSFHATKVFNTFEGGAVVSPDAATKQRLDQLRNFGITSEISVADVGLNGKMSEFNAAIGLAQLQVIDAAIAARARVDETYRALLNGQAGVRCVDDVNRVGRVCSYFPVLITDDHPLGRDAVYQRLRDRGIFARRYFYPLISDLPMYASLPSATLDNLPVAHRVAEQILCLPLHPELERADIEEIVQGVCA